MACLLEVRVGIPIPKVEGDPYPYDTAYQKSIINEPVLIKKEGIQGNLAGHPSNIKQLLHRPVLFFHTSTYTKLKEVFPSAASSLVRGSFAENFVVDDDILLPDQVCVGDIYQVGNVLLEVSGPRSPCFKIDQHHNVQGLTSYTRETGTSGYFARVLKEGLCQAGDEIILIKRIHETVTIAYVACVLYGSLYKEYKEYIDSHKLQLDSSSAYRFTASEVEKHRDVLITRMVALDSLQKVSELMPHRQMC